MPGPDSEYYKHVHKKEVLDDLNGMISRRTFVLRTSGVLFGLSTLSLAAGVGDYAANTDQEETTIRNNVKAAFPQPDATTVVYARQTMQAFQTPVAQAIRSNEAYTIPTAVSALGIKDADNIIEANDQSEFAQNQALESAGVAQRSKRDLYLSVAGAAGMVVNLFIGVFNIEGRSLLKKHYDIVSDSGTSWYSMRDVDYMKMGPGF